MSSLASPVDLKKIDDETVNLVNGFIRNAQETLKLTIPKPINLIVMTFYHEPIRFDICSRDEDMIKNDGKIFYAPSTYTNISAACSKGTKIGSLSLKVNKFNGYGIGIGITTDINNCTFSDWIFNYSLGITYYIYVLKTYKGYAWVAQASSAEFRVPQWIYGDLMRIEWDSNKGIFEYYNNDDKVGTINIKKGLIYYPCVCRHSEEEIEIEIVS